MSFEPGVRSLANFKLLDAEYVRKREIWKSVAPKHLLHPSEPKEFAAECGTCWLAKQILLIYNTEIYTWDGLSTRLSDEQLTKVYQENVKKIESCSCLKTI